MSKYGIDCIFLNNNNECDLGNDTEQCFKICKDREPIEENEEE